MFIPKPNFIDSRGNPLYIEEISEGVFRISYFRFESYLSRLTDHRQDPPDKTDFIQTKVVSYRDEEN
jgi:hypothetical protein